MKEVLLGSVLEEVSFRNKELKDIPVRSVTNQEGFCSPRDFFSKDVCSKDLSNYKVVKKGEFAYNPSRVNVGSIDYLDEESALVSPLYVTFKCKEKIIPRYLKYYLKGSKGNLFIRMKARGAVRDTLSFKSLAEIKIPLPAVDIQKQYVAELDCAADLCQKRKEQLSLFNNYLKSVFFNMFGDPEINDKGWKIKEFDYFATIDTKMTTDFQKYLEYPHIGISNIEKNTGVLFDYKSVKEEGLISGKYIFTPEHIIYSKIRPNLNKVALPNFHGLSSADSYPILVKKDHTNRIFFAFLLRSPVFINFILKHSKRTNIPKANKQQIRAFRGIAPPIDLQNKFSEIYEQVEQTKQKMQISLDEMNSHFDALMQKCFD